MLPPYKTLLLDVVAFFLPGLFLLALGVMLAPHPLLFVVAGVFVLGFACVQYLRFRS